MSQRGGLVGSTAARLRDIILAEAPDAQIGSLGELARRLDVGVVTVQQAARVLEHEGLLEVRRGPGGGYYGRRPTEASLERSVAAYLRVDEARYQEIFEMMSLLEAELAPAASRSQDPAFHAALSEVKARLDSADTIPEQLAVEEALHDVLFRMADQPLMSLLGRVTIGAYKANPAPSLLLGPQGVEAWRAARRRMIQAILDRDEERARFEAGRFRETLLARLSGQPESAAAAP